MSTPNPHVPDLSLPVSDVAIYKTLCITQLADWGTGVLRPLDAPLAFLDELAPPEVPAAAPPPAAAAPAPAAKEDGPRDGPAQGVLLTYEQAWRVKGVALGRLNHSLCLAPGEVTQIAVSDWSRTTTGSATEDQAAAELASKSSERQRQTTAITQAVASEAERSGSSTSSTASRSSIGGGGAFGLWGVSGSASVAHASGASAEYQVGVRNVAASSLNDVRQSTHQQAASARERSASLMQEVTETESETLMTRVIANYNHMHALNIQYYEVVQVFELSSRVTAAERCIFVPMAVMTFFEGDADEAPDGPVARVKDFAGPLGDAARLLGRPILVHALDKLWDQGADPVPKLEAAMNAKQTAKDDAAAAETSAAGGLAKANAARDLAKSTHGDAVKEREGLDRARDAAEALTELHRAISTIQIPAIRALLPDLDDTAKLRRVLAAATPLLRPMAPGVDPFGPLIKAAVPGGLSTASIDALLTDLGDRTVSEALGAWAQADAKVTSAATSLASATKDADREKLLHDAAVTDLSGATKAHASAKQAHDDAVTGRGFDPAQLCAALNEHRLWFNQWLWRQMTPPQVASLLGRRTYDGTPLVEQIEPEVVGIRDHYVAFRRPFAPDQAQDQRRFEREHIGSVDREDVRETVALPTGGLFAEAVLGTSNAAEKLDLTRFWKWDDSTIPILPTAISELRQRQHERLEEARPDDSVGPTLQVEDLPELAPPPRPSLGPAVSTPLFRDLADSQRITDVLAHTLEQASALDAEAQAEAQKNVQAYQEHLVQLIPIAQKVLAQGSDIDPSSLGALSNLVGDGELDVGALLGTAAKLGLLL